MSVGTHSLCAVLAYALASWLRRVPDLPVVHCHCHFSGGDPSPGGEQEATGASRAAPLWLAVIYSVLSFFLESSIGGFLAATVAGTLLWYCARARACLAEAVSKIRGLLCSTEAAAAEPLRDQRPAVVTPATLAQHGADARRC